MADVAIVDQRALQFYLPALVGKTNCTLYVHVRVYTQAWAYI